MRTQENQELVLTVAPSTPPPPIMLRATATTKPPASVALPTRKDQVLRQALVRTRHARARLGAARRASAPSRPPAAASQWTAVRAGGDPQSGERPLSVNDLTATIAPLVSELSELRGEVNGLATGLSELRGEVNGLDTGLTALRKEVSSTTRSVGALVEGFANFTADNEPSYRGVLASSLGDLASENREG